MQMINLPTLGIKTLSDLASVVSPDNIDNVLKLNNLPRVVNITKTYNDICNSIKSGIDSVSVDSKINLVGKYTSNSDIFEEVALSNEGNWKILQQNGTLENYLNLPDDLNIPLVAGVIGNGEKVKRITYDAVVDSLKTINSVPESIFTSFTSGKLASNSISSDPYPSSDVFQWFHIPWGKVTLYSSLDGTSVDFPVYPEELQDGRVANYDTMPDILYQYEPWQIYKSSGPRKVTYKFDFHRDMWTGDHQDGKAGELIRFCEACCYPQYNGAAVNTPTVDLYIGGKKHISGIMTECTTDWDGPIGLDDFYLHCVLSITIIEISPITLNYSAVKEMPMVGYN